MVIWVQDLWPEVFKAVEAPQSRLFFSLVKGMMKWIYKHSNVILVQSKDFIKPVIRIGAQKKRVLYFPNWAEELYKPIKLERSKRTRGCYKRSFCSYVCRKFRGSSIIRDYS